MSNHDDDQPGVPALTAGGGRDLARSRERRLDIGIVVLLAAASLLAAWAGHQAGLWSNRVTALVTEAGANQFQATRLTVAGSQLMAIDVALFLDWLKATRENDLEAAAFLEDRFTPHLKTAFAAWLATRPLVNPDAASDPFRMPDYRVPQLQEATVLQEQAAAVMADAASAITVSEAYVLSTILLAMVLFFGGVSAKADWLPVRVALLAIAVFLFLFTVVKLGGLPDGSSWGLTPVWP